MMHEDPYGNDEDLLIIDNHKPLSVVQQLVPKEEPPQAKQPTEETKETTAPLNKSASHPNSLSPRLNSLSVVNSENNGVVAQSSIRRKSIVANSPIIPPKTFSSLKDDFKIMYRVFTHLTYVELIRVGNTCSFWRMILRDCEKLSKQKEKLMGVEYVDLYERECKRLWPSNHDVSRYPQERPLATSNSAEVLKVRHDDDDEIKPTAQRRVSILELDTGGFRRMLLDRNRENELYPIVFLEFSKTTRKSYLSNNNTEFANLGRVEIKLNKKEAPKAAENFRCLCTGEKGLSPNSIPLYFKGATMHKALQATFIQGGDIVYSGASGWWQAQYGKEIASSRNDPNAVEGEGSESIYGQTFENDSSELCHNPGSVSCVVKPGNGCQFNICVAKCKELDGKQTVFGEVIKGQEVVRKIETLILTSQQSGNAPEDEEVVFIKSCGQMGFSGKTFDMWTHEILTEVMEEPKTVVRNEPVKSRACQIL